MDSKLAIKYGKETFYKTLEKHGVDRSVLIENGSGAKLLRVALGLAEMEKSAAKAPPQAKSVGNYVMDALRGLFANGASDVQKLTGMAAGGGLSGLGLGYTVGALNSPPNSEIGNLQKQELIAEYDTAIEDLRNRIAMRKSR